LVGASFIRAASGFGERPSANGGALSARARRRFYERPEGHRPTARRRVRAIGAGGLSLALMTGNARRVRISLSLSALVRPARWGNVGCLNLRGIFIRIAGYMDSTAQVRRSCVIRAASAALHNVVTQAWSAASDSRLEYCFLRIEPGVLSEIT
jgi:hypothetical protein